MRERTPHSVACAPAEFRAVIINNVILDGILPPEFQAQPPVTQQMPGVPFGFRLRVPQFANALRADSHGRSDPSPAPVPPGGRAPSPLGEGFGLKVLLTDTGIV